MVVTKSPDRGHLRGQGFVLAHLSMLQIHHSMDGKFHFHGREITIGGAYRSWSQHIYNQDRDQQRKYARAQPILSLLFGPELLLGNGSMHS